MAINQLNNVEQTDAKFLIERALAEDLGDCGDLTSRAMIPEHAEAKVNIVARQPGIVSGVAVAKLVFEIYDTSVDVSVQISDGGELKAGDVVATVSGKTRSLLSGERTALNFLTHLSGIATLTSQFVEQAGGTGATLLYPQDSPRLSTFTKICSALWRRNQPPNGFV